MAEVSDIVVAILPIYLIETILRKAKTVPENTTQMIELYCHLGLCLTWITDRFE